MEKVFLNIRPLTAEAFAPYGEVIEVGAGEVRLINQGATERHHALAYPEVKNSDDGDDAHVLINIFRSQPCAFPLAITMMERHPLGSQAFVPLQQRDFLVVVAHDEQGVPAAPEVFHARADQGVNYSRNVWHHPLLALDQVSDFLVVDRGGSGNNLEEYFYDKEHYYINNR